MDIVGVYRVLWQSIVNRWRIGVNDVVNLTNSIFGLSL